MLLCAQKAACSASLGKPLATAYPSTCRTPTSLDDTSINLVTTAIRQAAGRPRRMELASRNKTMKMIPLVRRALFHRGC